MMTRRIYFNQRLEIYGVHPGNWNHWEGIFLAPFLHGSTTHLISNSMPLLILGALILLNGWERLATASFVSAGVAGIFTILVGDPDSYHIGSSSVVYGYLGFLVGLGWYQKTPISIFIASVVIFLYWGAIHTMYPNEITRVKRISWEGHLGGALGGLLAARFYRMR